MDHQLVRRHVDKTVRRMFDILERKRDTFTQIAREFIPSAVPGFTKDETELAEGYNIDEAHPYYTTIPQTQLNKGAAGFHTNLTSPARPWFRLRAKAFGDSSIHEGASAVNAAMDAATEAVEWLMASTNCYSQCHKFYRHWLAFGTAAMLVLPDRDKIARTVTLRPGTYALDVGADGKVNRLARKFSWTVEQLVERFGRKNIPESILKKTDRQIRYPVINLIEPNGSNEDRAWDRISKTIGLDGKYEFRSIYFFKDSALSPETQGLIKPVKGFLYNPIVACRYEYEHGDVWGYSVGQMCLPTAKGLNSYKYDLQKVSGDTAEPAVVASSSLKDEGLQLGRRGVNWTAPGEQRENLVVPVFTGDRNMTLTKEEAMEARQELADAFYVSTFATIDALKLNPGVKTATEIEQLVRENLEMLGAHVANLNEEFLDPLVTAYFRLAQNAGIARTDKDEALGGININSVEIEYVSAVHLAQKAAKLKNSRMWLAFVTDSAQADPSLTQLPNWEVAAREIGRMMGVPERMVKSDREFEQIRKSLQAQAEEQAQTMKLAQNAGVAKDIAAMPIDMNHAGGRLAEALGG
jgi:hypothetical protein